MSIITAEPTVVNYPSERYSIAYDPCTHLFACSYGGEVFDHALCYDDGHLQCSYHWAAQAALEACPDGARQRAAAYVLRAYPGAAYARWSDLTGGYDPIPAPYCVLTHANGYGIHAVLPNGTLGALIERVRL